MRFKVYESFKRPESVVSAAAKHLDRTTTLSTEIDGRALIFRTEDNSIQSRVKVSEKTVVLYHIEDELGQAVSEPTESLEKVYSEVIDYIKSVCFPK